MMIITFPIKTDLLNRKKSLSIKSYFKRELITMGIMGMEIPIKYATHVATGFSSNFNSAKMKYETHLKKLKAIIKL